MSLRLTKPMLAISLLVLGCAISAPESSRDDRIWREQLQRQQEVVRNQGRIGHIGYEGPSSR
jgi:outer membrane biogenesis lipoprotein LolB